MTTLRRPRKPATHTLRPALATAVFKAGSAFPAVGAALVEGWVSA